MGCGVGPTHHQALSSAIGVPPACGKRSPLKDMSAHTTRLRQRNCGCAQCAMRRLPRDNQLPNITGTVRCKRPHQVLTPSRITQLRHPKTSLRHSAVTATRYCQRSKVSETTNGRTIKPKSQRTSPVNLLPRTRTHRGPNRRKHHFWQQ